MIFDLSPLKDLYCTESGQHRAQKSHKQRGERQTVRVTRAKRNVVELRANFMNCRRDSQVKGEIVEPKGRHTSRRLSSRTESEVHDPKARYTVTITCGWAC